MVNSEEHLSAEQVNKPRLALNKKVIVLLFLLIFICAFLIRLMGIGWGLPNEMRNQSLHPDEPVIAGYAISQPYFLPDFYNYGTLYLTTLKLSVDLGVTYGWIPIQSDTGETWRTTSAVHLSGRVISAFFGSVTVALVFLILLYFAHPIGAFVGALTLMLSAGHVVHSRFQTVDIFGVFWLTLSALFLVNVLYQKQEKHKLFLLLCGLCIGLSAGTKYNLGLFLIAGLSALLFFPQQVRLKYGMILTGSFAFGFLIATPGAILQFSSFLRDFTYELRHTSEGHGLVFTGTTTGWIYHLGNLISSFGFAPVLIGIIGLIFGAKRQVKSIIVFSLFILIFYFTIALAEVKFMRYVFPLLPFLAVGCGYLFSELHKMSNKARFLAGVMFVFVGFSFASNTGAINLTQLMRISDPRDQSARWLLNELTKEQTVGLVADPWFYTPPLFKNTGFLGATNRLKFMEKENPQVLRYTDSYGKRLDWDSRLIIEYQPDYIVFSSFEFADFDRTNNEEFIKFMDLLSKRYYLKAVFWGNKPLIAERPEDGENFGRLEVRKIFRVRYPYDIHDLMYIQPTICVFKIKTKN